MKLKACTIATVNQFAQVKVLAASFKAHHPGGEFAALVIDSASTPGGDGGELFDVVRLQEIGLPPGEISRMAMLYDAAEFCVAVKPWLLRHQLGDGAEAVLYLDPDIEVYSPLDDIFELARVHGIVLTPHTIDPVPRDGLRVDETDILAMGVYNPGFLGVGKGCGDFLDWLSERLLRDCHGGSAGAGACQRWLDFVPCMYPHHILKDHACNVAYWNLHSRSLAWTGERYEIDGRPLRFFQFSGFDPDEPHLVNKQLGEKPRILLSSNPDLARLYGGHLDKLEKAGFHLSKNEEYGYSRLGNGPQITLSMRQFYREALRSAGTNAGDKPPLPFEPGCAKTLLAWMNEPVAPDCLHFTRFLQFIYSSRLDLRRAFPYPTNRDAVAFIDWVYHYGRWEHDIPLDLIPSRTIAGAVSKEQIAPPGQPVPLIDVVGYFQAELGLGETARLLISGIEASGIPYTSITSREILSRQDHPFQHTGSGDSGAGIKILCINCDHMPAFMQRVSPGFMEGRHVIGLWFWELEYYPQDMVASFDFVDEVWTGSSFTAEAFRKVTAKPVYVFPHPFLTPAAAPSHSRAELGLPDRFIFYFAFDFFSTIERKNPIGLIAAFKKVFAPGEGPVLVIKSINGDKKLASFEKLQYAAAGREDILVMDQYLSPERRDSMMANCDCYVSLHRSEGLGMTMAEAMLHGKPVIATRYSGNLEFMSGKNSYLVSHRLRPVGNNSEHYPPEGEWADPDIEEAAALMRHVYENPDEAAKRGRQARLDVGAKLSPEACAHFVKERVADIRAKLFPLAPESAEEACPEKLRAAVEEKPFKLGNYWRALRKS